MKFTFEVECPCGDHKIKIQTETESRKPEELFCPFCSCLIDEQEEDEYEDSDDS